jgi:hypothetical protein
MYFTSSVTLFNVILRKNINYNVSRFSNYYQSLPDFTQIQVNFFDLAQNILEKKRLKNN